MILIYNIFIFILKNVFYIGSYFNTKIKKGSEGRSFFDFNQLKDFKGAFWFHVASYGEFEQIKYLVHCIKNKYSDQKIVVTFFSPSGYYQALKNKDIDAIFYLPFDTKYNALQFLKNLQPSIVFWVRYEFWFHFLFQIKNHNIPLYLINGVFPKSYNFLYAIFLKKILFNFKQIFVINQSSKLNLKHLGFDSKILADSRYDRMQEVVKTKYKDSKIEQFIDGHQTVVLGSTWHKDEILIREIMDKFPTVKWILVPHEVHSKRIEEIGNLFKDASFYSKEINNHSNILVIDSIGMLSKLYRYADVCYVGGGFNKVVHSVLEPLSYIKPVLSGPNIAKSEEALSYQKTGFLETINSASELETKLSDYLNKTHPEKQNETQEFIQSQLGSTKVLLELVEEELGYIL